MKHPPLAVIAVALAVLAGLQAFAQAPAGRRAGAAQDHPARAVPARSLEAEPRRQGAVHLPGVPRQPDLEVKVYGPDPALQGGKSVLKTTGTDGDDNNPTHLFSGECKTACGFTLRSRKAFANLAVPFARVRVNSKMSGLHTVYLAIKLADGSWAVGTRQVSPCRRATGSSASSMSPV